MTTIQEYLTGKVRPKFKSPRDLSDAEKNAILCDLFRSIEHRYIAYSGDMVLNADQYVHWTSLATAYAPTPPPPTFKVEQRKALKGEAYWEVDMWRVATKDHSYETLVKVPS